MILQKGDMWSIFSDTDYFCITGNSTVKSNNQLVMGVGIAKQAKNSFS